MKHVFTNQTMKSKKKIGYILLLILFFMLTVTLLPKLIQTSDVVANAQIDYSFISWEGNTGEVYLQCANCGHMYMFETERGEEIMNWYEDGFFEEWELYTPYCRHCYEGHLCGNCHKPRDDSDAEGYCDTCNLCFQCWDIDKHCQVCCEEKELCPECLDAGQHRCLDCHSETSHCPDCGRCLYPLYDSMEVDADNGIPHCTLCDEPFICTDCCECFFNDRANFCDQCEKCIDCAVTADEHCVYCQGCLQCTDRCTDNEGAGVCLECCIAEGFHCCYCLDHVDDNWCVGGVDCCHCADCADGFGWICSGCDRCQMCDGFEFCEDCGYCIDCCHEAAEAAGCQCLQYCILSGEFEDAEHMCQSCGSHFVCEGEDFCEDCGYCQECCLALSEEYGCVCGLCVESADFDEHLCTNCGEPSCVRGDICPYCGFCEECCYEESDTAGCSCGMCVEDDDFYSSEHYCENCEAFSCNIDFCYDCNLCVDCCEENTKELGCNHTICIQSSDWKDHYCTTCERCKEDCDCGQSCCTASGEKMRSLHGTRVAIGTILRQPSSKIRTVTGNSKVDRADNTVTFIVRAYDPYGSLQYQWYQKIEGETPDKLVNESEYIESTDETLVFVGGAQTNTLTVSVPCDACKKAYSYYCVISSDEDDVYVETERARLVGRHSYEWVSQDKNTHAYGCIGCGEVEEGTAKAHEIGPWHYQYYATAQYGARLVRTCRVCGGVADSRTTEPLGYHPYHTFIYQPVIEVDAQENESSQYHEKICRCGYSEVGKELHDWDSWVVTEPADEKHKGSKYRDCLTCNYRETVVIPKQTHEHTYTLHSYTDGERIFTDSMYHWQYCTDPDCNALAFKEEHQFTEWSWVRREARLDDRDEKIIRTCTVCGYKETITMKQYYFAFVLGNAEMKKVQTQRWDDNMSCLYCVTAQPPTGYYFDHWEIVGGSFKFGEHVVEVDGHNEYKEYTVSDPYIEFYLRTEIDWMQTLYQLQAVCYRYDNHLIVYPSGDYLGAKETTSDGTLLVESIEEDEFGYRTMTVRLRGYNGGAIEVDDTGLPCNLRIIVDKDSTITTSGQEAILGCASGGNIVILSENGASLTIQVKNKKEDTCYGIRSRRSRSWCEDKITFAGNIHMFIDVKSTGSYGTAVGVYSKTWIEINDSAQMYITVSAKGNPEEKTIMAVGMEAGKEIQIDTNNRIEIFATDVASDKKGQGLKAKNIIIDKVELLAIDFLATSRSGYNVKPTYDPKEYVSYTYLWDSGTKKRTVVEAGCLVSFTADENVTIDVDEWYQTEEGTYLVTEDEGLFFSVTPALGYYDVHVFVDGLELKPLESPDGVTKNYVIDMVDADKQIQITSGAKFSPYASMPDVAQEKIYSSNDAVVSFRLNNVIDALIDHAKLGGKKALNPQFRAEMGKYSDGELITNNFTVNRIFLQRYNETSDLFINTDFSFIPSVIGDIRFNDSAKNIGKTIRYRLMIVFDGEEYPSDEFAVTWTDDPNDIVMPTVRTVELHIKRATAGYQGGTCEGGDAWIRLDSENECYVFDVDLNKGFACSNSYYLRKWKTEHLLKVAEFNYHTGTLVLYGNGYSYDFDDNGVKETYDLAGEILAIRASDCDGFEGGLTIDVRGDTTIGGSYEKYGYEGWYDNKGTLVKTEHNHAQESVILNQTNDGFVRIISSNAKENAPISFMMTRTGGESGLTEARDYCGIKASGDISIEGNMQVTIFINIDSDITEYSYLGKADRYGLYTPENVTLRGNVHLACNLPVYNTSLCLRGEAEGIHAGGTVNLLDDSITSLTCDAYKAQAHDPYYALCTGSLNVVGNAYLELTIGEQIFTAVCAGEVLIATTSGVKIRATDEGTIYAFTCNGGTVTVQNPSTFKMLSQNGHTLVDSNSQILFDGNFVHYHMDAHDYLIESDDYYSGIAYCVSVTQSEETEYYNATYDITVDEPAPTSYLITELSGEGSSVLDVRYGDSVCYIATEPEKGFRFDGWEIKCPVSIENLVQDGRTIQFTMPDCDIILCPLYVCTAFEDTPPYFVIREEESLHGELYWRADVAETLYYATLEYLDENGEWVSAHYQIEENDFEYWNLNEESSSYEEVSIGIAGVKSYRGVQKLKIEGEDGEGIPLNPAYTTYRIHVFCSNGEPYSCNSEPFVIDFEKGIHILVSESASAPGISVPSDYIGTEYTVDLSEYIYSATGMTYEVVLRDIGGVLSSDICKVTVDENIVTFERNGVHSTIFAMENGTYFVATDKVTGKEFRIPYEFGEILDSEAYPVVVNGKRAISKNKDDILGDGGSVSYNPTTKTLTLTNAHLTEIYSETTDGEALAGGYAIMSVQDIIINLVGKNVIDVNPYSYCYNKPSYSAFNGKIIAIGNISNSAKWNSYLTEKDTHSITFTGDGSLEITVKGQNSSAVRSLKNITVNGGDITVTAEENGLTSEGGSVIVNGGKLSVNAKKKSCVDLKSGSGHFNVWDGTVHFNGGTDDYVIAMNEEGYSNSIYFDKGDIVLATKSTTRNLSNRSLDYNTTDFITYYLEEGELTEGEPEVTNRYIKMSRAYYVWVNGERITPENLEVECGSGKAIFDPETNTLTLKYATITKGISYYNGIPYSAGIYTEEPINIEFVGNCKIDLTQSDFYEEDTGEKYELYGEDEQYRQVYGIQVSNVLYGSHGYENRLLTLSGSTCKFIGVDEGIISDNSVIVDGAKLTVTDCMVGIDVYPDLILKSGSIRIDACDDEYAYAVYGNIKIQSSYSPVSIFGSTSGDLVSLSLTELKTAYDDAWGAHYRSLWIRNEEITNTIYHDWNEPTYVWSEDGKKVTATRVCKNDVSHIETETVDVQSVVVQAPSCSELGETTYSAYFTNTGFSAQSKTLADIDLIPHTEAEPVRENEVDATCSAEGSYDEVVYCSVCGAEISRKAKTIPISSHDWNDPTYTWSEDGTQITATRVCKNNANHIETETVTVISKVTQKPSCTVKGETTYTSANFVNTAFSVQTRTLADITALGHTQSTAVREHEVAATCTVTGSYDEVVYCSVCGEEVSRTAQVIPIDETAHDWGEWTMTKTPTETEAGEKTRVCQHNSSHKETKTVAALGRSVLIEITEENAGKGVDVKALFETAKEDNKEVMISVGGVEITFDSEAVGAIGENTNITFSMTESDEVSGEIEGAQKVLNITVTGFTAGKSKVTVPFDEAIPENKIAKVYYVDDAGNKTDMNATFAGGTAVFETTHFSKYVIVFEDKPTVEPDIEPIKPDINEKSLSTGAIVGIVVAVITVIGLVILIISVSKKKKKR